MPSSCPALSDDVFLSSMLLHLDCQAQAIGEGGYHALASAGSPAAMAMTGAFTILVALFGYRLLLGETPSMRDGAVTVVRIGMVLVLATSWSAFRTLAYDVTMRAPADLASRIGAPADLPGAGGELVDRLQTIDSELARLAVLGTGRPADLDVLIAPSATTSPTPSATQTLQSAPPVASSLLDRPRWDPQHDAALVGTARTVYLAGAIGAFGSVRLIAGVLLGLGPFFAIFLLFDATRGVFAGWVRGLGGAALGALATAIVLGVELALVEPWLSAVVSLREAGEPTPAVPAELMALSLGFAVTLAGTLIAVAKVAHGFRFPDGWRAVPVRLVERVVGSDRVGIGVPAAAQSPATPTLDRGRAARIAEAVVATQRREAGSPSQATRLAEAVAANAATVKRGSPDNLIVAPLGRSFSRRTQRRHSAGAAGRDQNR